MASPIIDNLVLPDNVVLVLPDVGSETTGVIVLRSALGGGHFLASNAGVNPYTVVESDHVLFVKEMAAEVQVNDIMYFAMNTKAIVGLIPAT